MKNLINNTAKNLEYNIDECFDNINVSEAYEELLIKNRLKYNYIINGGCCSYDWTCSWTSVSGMNVAV